MKKKQFACVSSTKLDFSVRSFDFRLQVEADHHGATKHTHMCVSSTKLDFSVGSFDFRLQVEADHHEATKHTQQTNLHLGASQYRLP